MIRHFLLAFAAILAAASPAAAQQRELTPEELRQRSFFVPMRCGWVRDDASQPYTALFGPYRTLLPSGFADDPWPGPSGQCRTAGRAVPCPQATGTGPYSYCTRFSGQNPTPTTCNWVDITSAVQMRADAGSTWQARCTTSNPNAIEIRYWRTNPAMHLHLVRGDTRARPVSYTTAPIQSDGTDDFGFDPGATIPLSSGGWIYTAFQYRGSGWAFGAESQLWKLYFTRTGCTLTVQSSSGDEGASRYDVYARSYGSRNVPIC